MRRPLATVRLLIPATTILVPLLAVLLLFDHRKGGQTYCSGVAPSRIVRRQVDWRPHVHSLNFARPQATREQLV